MNQRSALFPIAEHWPTCEIDLPATREDAYASQTGYSAYAWRWENTEDRPCSEPASLPPRSIRSIKTICDGTSMPDLAV
jgi:hypothetical protein